MIATLLLAVTLQVGPTRPTVGDTVTFKPTDGAIVVDVRTQPPVEVVQKSAHHFAVRAFAPGPHPVLFAVQRTGGVTWERVEVRIGSVLKPNDDGAPAALQPPLPAPENLVAQRALIAAAAVALLSWLAVYLLKRRAAIAPEAVSVHDRHAEFLRALHEAEHLHGAAAAVRLADAVRAYLPVVGGRFSADLTTRELLQSARSGGFDQQQLQVIRRVLDDGDYAKFAPWRFVGATVPVDEGRRLAQREEVAA